MSARHVVILGGGIAGVATAHKLLKYTSPKAKDLKVILVAANSHVYWNMAAVRGVLPDEFSDETLFYDIAPGFSKFLDSQFELVIGTATGLDLAAKTVRVDVAQSQEERSIEYNQLVIATGAAANENLPFKCLETHEATVNALHDLQAAIGAAQSIVLAGAGPTGVELAGELGHRYGGDKTITLVIEGSQVLPGCLPSVAKTAEKELANLKVELVHDTRVTNVEDAPAAGEPKTVNLSNGSTLTADLYLPLFGVRANADFVPAELKDDRGNIKQQRTLRAEGQNDVWAVGDVGNLESKQAARLEPQVIHLAKNLHAVLTGTPDKVTNYKPSDQVMVFVPLGKKKGTGQVGGFKVFGFLVSRVKGKTFFTEKASGLVSGKNIVRQPL